MRLRLSLAAPTLPPYHAAVAAQVGHGRDLETAEAKALWFQSLSFEERIELFCEVCDLALAAHPELLKGSDAQPVAGRVCVLTAP